MNSIHSKIALAGTFGLSACLFWAALAKSAGNGVVLGTGLGLFFLVFAAAACFSKGWAMTALRIGYWLFLILLGFGMAIRYFIGEIVEHDGRTVNPMVILIFLAIWSLYAALSFGTARARPLQT